MESEPTQETSPDEAERERMRAEIVAELTPILAEQFAADAWGRLLVSLTKVREGAPWIVDGLDVEEIEDEETVERIFGGAPPADLPALAAAAEALCALDGVDLRDVEGITIIRTTSEKPAQFAVLPGLVRTPTHSLDQRRDALGEWLDERHAELFEEVGQDAGFSVDVDKGQLTFHQGDTQSVFEHVLLATFDGPTRMFAWGAKNPSLPASAQKRCAAVLDELPDRNLWEISTPAFPSDEPTAWLLTAYVAEHYEARGVLATRQGDSVVFHMVGGDTP